jgi:tetratricopeptide (TPR) repeat protein
MPQPVPFDLDAARRAMTAGQSLAEHAGLSRDLLRLLYASAVGHYEARRHDEAIQALVQLVLLDLRHADAWALLGNCHQREGRFAEALQAWQSAMTLRADPALATLVARTALALKDRESAAEALLALRQHVATQTQADEFNALAEGLRELTA